LYSFFIFIKDWLSGFFSAWTILLEQKSRRSELALYVLPRTIDSLWQIVLSRKWMPVLPQGEKILFMMGMACIMYYREKYPEVMSPLLRKVLEFFVPNEYDVHSNKTESSSNNNTTQSLHSQPQPFHSNSAIVSYSPSQLNVSSSSSSFPPIHTNTSPSPSSSLSEYSQFGSTTHLNEGVIPLPTPGISFSRETSFTTSPTALANFNNTIYSSSNINGNNNSNNNYNNGNINGNSSTRNSSSSTKRPSFVAEKILEIEQRTETNGNGNGNGTK
jgi:hypothetical protein